MSLRTQFFAIFLITTLGALNARPVRAEEQAEDPFLKAQAKLNQGMTEYFNALVNSGTVATPETIKRLRSQYLDGPSQEMKEAAKQNFQATMAKAGLTTDPSKGQPAQVDVKKYMAMTQEQRDKAASEQKGAVVLNNDVKEEKPEVALDGSKIPKDLAFRGAQKSKNKDKAPNLADAKKAAKPGPARKPASADLKTDILNTAIPTQ